MLILDGGLSTTLESYGHDISGYLWSARLLADQPEAIVQAHLDFLRAGANIITTASYQASYPGYAQAGFDRHQATELLQRSVQLAQRARDLFLEDVLHQSGLVRPQVAASLGPYGAYLADGSEYRGDYEVDEAVLAQFHRERLPPLLSQHPDWLAFETLPSLTEAKVIARLLAAEFPQVRAWLSFSCQDGERISDGTPLREAVTAIQGVPAVAAIGINCTPPIYIESLLRHARSATAKPLLAYPNRGEAWDAQAGCWVPSVVVGQAAQGGLGELSDNVPRWQAAGASIIGGCCRVGPEDIARLSA